MSSTAVLISGQARTFPSTFPTQLWHVYRHFKDLHFFVVLQNTPDAPASVKLLEAKYGKDRIHVKLIEDPKDLPMIAAIHGRHAPFANAAPHPQLMMQHWYQYQVWKFYKETPREDKTIIRMRTDNFFHSFAPNLPLNKDLEPIVEEGTVHSPWWGRFGGINDRFAIMDAPAGESYFCVYPNIQKLLDAGCPFHPESLLKASIEDADMISKDTLDAQFSTWRMDANHRHMEILAGDIAHRAAH